MKFEKIPTLLLAAVIASSVGVFAYGETPRPDAPANPDTSKPVLYTDKVLTPVGDRIEVTKVDVRALIASGTTLQIIPVHSKDVTTATATLIDQSLRTDGSSSAYKCLSTEDQARFSHAKELRTKNMDNATADSARAADRKNDARLESQLTQLRSTFKAKYNQDLAFTADDFLLNTNYAEAKVDEPAKLAQWPVRAIFPEAGKPTGMVFNDKNRKEPKALLGNDTNLKEDTAAQNARIKSETDAARADAAKDDRSQHNLLKTGDSIGVLKLDGNNVSPAVVVSTLQQDGATRIVLPQASTCGQIEMNLANQVEALNQSKIWDLDAAAAKRIIAKNVLMAYYDDRMTSEARSVDNDTPAK